MKPTLEEVKSVARECTVKTKHSGFNAGRLMTYEELQTFAQHWMKVQREMEEIECEKLYYTKWLPIDNIGE